MKEKIVDLLRRLSFQPTVAAIVVNPFYLIRRSLFKNISSSAKVLQGKLLDFGCGRKPYENLFNVTEYIGIDLENTGHNHKLSKVDVFYDGKTIPFPDETFDAVFCSEVIEHVFNPDEVLPEISRVMKTGAKALFTVPFCWNEHEMPYDYARYTVPGFTHLLAKNGFKVLEVKKSGHFLQVHFQLLALYFYEGFKKWGRAGMLLSLVFIVPINLAGAVISFLLPRQRSLYFNTIILAEK